MNLNAYIGLMGKTWIGADQGGERVLCGRVPVDSLADANAMDVNEAPRCARCAKRLATLRR